MEGDRHEANNFNKISFRGISGYRWELTARDVAQTLRIRGRFPRLTDMRNEQHLVTRVGRE